LESDNYSAKYTPELAPSKLPENRYFGIVKGCGS